MQLRSIAAHQTEIEGADGTVVLYSYSTPVAAFVPGRGALCTTTKYSQTTARDINAAVQRWGATRVDVGQAEIDKLAGGVA